MGFYVWLGLGIVVGVIARLLTPKRLDPSWAAHLSVSVAGALVGGWIGTRVWAWGYGINNMGVPAMIAAVVGAVVLLGMYLLFYRRKPTEEVRRERQEGQPRKIA